MSNPPLNSNTFSIDSGKLTPVISIEATESIKLLNETNVSPLMFGYLSRPTSWGLRLALKHLVDFVGE
jgi:hypothetical protein